MPIKAGCRQLFFILILLVLALNLGGCSTCEKPDCNVIPPYAGCRIISPVNMGDLHGCLTRNRCLLESLKHSGVQVIIVGDNITIVLRSDQVFVPNTPVMNRAYYPVLNQVTAFLCCLEKINIKVSGYTDTMYCPDSALALSRQQAQAVADYLWRRGLDVRVLYATGYGACYPIACNTTSCGRSMNRRIEITLRKISDYYDY